MILNYVSKLSQYLSLYNLLSPVRYALSYDPSIPRAVQQQCAFTVDAVLSINICASSRSFVLLIVLPSRRKRHLTPSSPAANSELTHQIRRCLSDIEPASQHIGHWLRRIRVARGVYAGPLRITITNGRVWLLPDREPVVYTATIVALCGYGGIKSDSSMEEASYC